MDKLNGVYIEYHDSLRMDAFRAWVYKDGINILNTDHDLLKALTNNSEYQLKDALRDIKSFGGYSVIMLDSCNYYGTLGLRDAVKIIKDKYPELNKYAFEIGWYTFPQEWRPVNGYFGDKYIMIPGKSEEYFKKILERMYDSSIKKLKSIDTANVATLTDQFKAERELYKVESYTVLLEFLDKIKSHYKVICEDNLSIFNIDNLYSKISDLVDSDNPCVELIEHVPICTGCGCCKYSNDTYSINIDGYVYYIVSDDFIANIK